MKKFCRNSSDAQDKTAETTTGSDINVLPVKYDMMLHSHSLTHACVTFGFPFMLAPLRWLTAQHGADLGNGLELREMREKGD